REAGKHSTPVMRAKTFFELCAKKRIHLGDGELIVGEKGPSPKAVPTFPELTCHSAHDLRILNQRPMARYTITEEEIKRYQDEVIPYWRGRSMRDRLFSNLPEAWTKAYEAGLFTEFMEQRAPGHTALDGLIYQKGLLEIIGETEAGLQSLDHLNDPQAAQKAQQLHAMAIACKGAIVFAERHAELAEERANETEDAQRRAELRKIATICRKIPAQAPATFHEALQMYWFVHLGTTTELNGWDAMSPGHLDQHLAPFYNREIGEGTLTRDEAKELLACFWIKFNNQPAPPKVGVTAKESGTYNDFTNINIGGVTRKGWDGSSEVSLLLLEVAGDMQLLQPQCNVQVSPLTPKRVMRAAVRVIRKGLGYPSLFNTEAVVMEQVRAGKTVEDAREGGTSGCIETGAFGKEAYVLTGYLNVPKILEIALNNGKDPRTGAWVGAQTGEPSSLKTFEALYHAFEIQLRGVVETKVKVNNLIERMYAEQTPAPFLSCFIEGCIEKGMDYYNGGPRYNTTYIQCCGIGTVTDSFSAISTHVFEKRKLSLSKLVSLLNTNFKGEEALRLTLKNKTPLFGNDDDRADALMQRIYASLFNAIDGRPNTKGGKYHLNMLSTTCHVYFGKVLGATPNGRLAGEPESDGTSPSQGADRNGPTAVVKSLSKMDQVKSGGTLLNMRLMPRLLSSEEDRDKLIAMVRTYFAMGGHHIQFNVVDTKTLEAAQKDPENHRNLLVRVAGYSDYFVDLDRDHQNEILSRHMHEGF
ncbi:MAG: glycyl radical protein, partial [Desulfobacterales bacterium]|nr:glycyl radical protein [Desulfobacterales bacterium]